MLLLLTTSWFGTVSDAHATYCPAPAGGPACGGSSLGSNQPASNINNYAGNPVNMMSGNKYQGDLDFRAADSLLMFKRHYNSVNAGYNLGLGHGWSNTYNVSIVHRDRDRLAVIQSDGRIIHFRRSTEASSTTHQTDNQTQVYLPADADDGIIKITDTSQQWLLSDGRRFYFKGPFLTRITTQNGQSVSLYYQNQRLHSVTDHLVSVSNLGKYSEELSNGKDADEPHAINEVIWPGHLVAIELPGEQRIEYKYDSRGQLASVKYPEGSVTDYRYANEIFNGILTERLENKQLISKWQYDESARVSRFENIKHRSYLDFEYTDVDATSTEGSTIVTDHTGGSTKYEWQRVEAELNENVEHPFDEPSYRIINSIGENCIGCPDLVAEHTASVIDVHAMANKEERLTRRGIEVLESDALGYPSSIRLITPDRHKLSPNPESTNIYTAEFDSRGNLLELKSVDESSETITFGDKQVQINDPVKNQNRVSPKELTQERLELLSIAVDLEKAIEQQPMEGISLIRDLFQPDQPQQPTTNNTFCAVLTCDDLETADFYRV